MYALNPSLLASVKSRFEIIMLVNALQSVKPHLIHLQPIAESLVCTSLTRDGFVVAHVCQYSGNVVDVILTHQLDEFSEP